MLEKLPSFSFMKFLERLICVLKSRLNESHWKGSLGNSVYFPFISEYTYFFTSSEKQQCPGKHIYKECGPSNPPTCSNVAPFQDSECVSGCTCPEGNLPVSQFMSTQQN